MEVTQETIEGLSAEIKIKLQPEDYQTQFETSLKKYAKQVNIQGFRPGKAPIGLIKRKHGREILAEEINKLLQESVNTYLKDNNITILAQPLPKENENSDINWDNPNEMEFLFDIGLAPNFEVAIEDIPVMPFYKIAVEESWIEETIKEALELYSTYEPTDVSGHSNMLEGVIKELNEDGTEKENGFNKEQVRLLIEKDIKEEFRDKFSGLKKGDHITINRKQDFIDDHMAHHILGVSHEELDVMSETYSFEITEVKKLKKAEFSQEFFDKYWGKGVVATEEEFKSKLKKSREHELLNQGDQKFYTDVVQYLLDKYNFDLPNLFLKKWVAVNSEKPVSEEDLDKDFPDIEKSMRWQLIESRLGKLTKINVEPEEIREKIKSQIYGYLASYGMTGYPEEQIEAMVNKQMSEKENVQKIYGQIFNEKLLEFFKEKLTLEEKEISLSDFEKLSKKT